MVSYMETTLTWQKMNRVSNKTKSLMTWTWSLTRFWCIFDHSFAEKRDLNFAVFIPMFDSLLIGIVKVASKSAHLRKMLSKSTLTSVNFIKLRYWPTSLRRFSLSFRFWSLSCFSRALNLLYVSFLSFSLSLSWSSKSSGLTRYASSKSLKSFNNFSFSSSS